MITSQIKCLFYFSIIEDTIFRPFGFGGKFIRCNGKQIVQIKLRIGLVNNCFRKLMPGTGPIRHQVVDPGIVII